MFIFLLIIFIISSASIAGSREVDESKVSTIFFSIIALISLITIIIYLNTPKAIDVYKNKTTLEITYKDNIPIDSVVVFKNK